MTLATKHVYNSRIIKNVVEYLQRYYPALDQDTLLAEAGISRYEINDPAHWMTQQQFDRFYEVVREHTQNSAIARDVGRFSAYSESWATVKHYLTGFISPGIAYRFAKRIGSYLDKAHTYRVKQRTRTSIEYVSIPKPGVQEQPYQCENRIGLFEAVGMWFTDAFADVQHPQCIHRGDACCRYVIVWKIPRIVRLRQVRNYLLGSTPALAFIAGLSVFSGTANQGLIWLSTSLLTGLGAWFAEQRITRELTHSLEEQRNITHQLLEETNARYTNIRMLQELGQSTAAIDDRQTLLTIVSNTIARYLDGYRGMILLPEPSIEHLRYAAGYGLTMADEARLNATTFPLEISDRAGIFSTAFRERRTVIIADRATSEQALSAEEHRILEALRIEAVICLPILYEDDVFGLLTVCPRHANPILTQTDLNLFTTLAAYIAITLVNVYSFEQLQTSLQEKSVLLKEIHHRVKNNLQIISSLLHLQAGLLQDQHAQMMFQESQQRVRTMALIHEKLYGSRNLSRIDAREFITTLARELATSYQQPGSTIEIVCDIAETEWDIDRAIPCGLIITELTSNAMKYAFPQNVGTVTIRLALTADDDDILLISDNGIGLPQDFHLDHLTSLGLQLVQGLVEEQLNGRLIVMSQPAWGTTWQISIPLAPHAGRYVSGQ